VPASMGYTTASASEPSKGTAQAPSSRSPSHTQKRGAETRRIHAAKPPRARTPICELPAPAATGPRGLAGKRAHQALAYDGVGLYVGAC
jgi:hypothetical protein